MAQMPQVEVPVLERYANGIYAREVIIPADTLLTGRIYLDDHFDVMVYGDITVSSDDGCKRLQGFNMFEGVQGKKRAGYTHAETRWITFCACPDLPAGEHLEHLTVLSFAEFVYRLAERPFIAEAELRHLYEGRGMGTTDYRSWRMGYLTGSGKVCKEDLDHADYQNMLEEYGFDEATVREQSENTADMAWPGWDGGDGDGVTVAASTIEGLGFFASELFESGDDIMLAKVGDYRTPAGRYTNHSGVANAIMAQRGPDIMLTALRRIKVGDEITVDYRASLRLQGVSPCQE